MEEIDSASVHKQMERICGSQEFAKKTMLCSMLTYLVTEHIAGRSNRIKGYSIATDVFGRDEDFDPDQNSLVRIHAGRLRRQLRLYYLDAGKNDPLIIEIPKGRYIPRISSNKSEKGVKSIKKNVARAKGKPKIAVLPFKNFSEKPEFDYLATGFSQELSETLTKFDDFTIVGINLVAAQIQFDDEFLKKVRQKDISYLIGGGIQDIGEQILFRYKLIDVSDNSQLWADKFKFNKEENNLFNTVEKISIKIANNIGSAYGRINIKRQRLLGRDRPDSLLEQDLILKFYHYTYALSEEVAIDFQKSVFKALELEPNSAIINSMASEIFAIVYVLDYPGADEAYKNLGYHAEKAYLLEPNSHQIITAFANKCFYFGENERFMQLLEKYKDILAKTPHRLGAMAWVACRFGQWKIGMKLLDEVFENNLNIPDYFYIYRATYYYQQKDYSRALEEAKKNHIPGLLWTPLHRAINYAQLGKKIEAKKEVKDLLTIRPDFETRGRYIISITLKGQNSLVDHMIEGLEKADLKLA